MIEGEGGEVGGVRGDCGFVMSDEENLRVNVRMVRDGGDGLWMGENMKMVKWEVKFKGRY